MYRLVIILKLLIYGKLTLWILLIIVLTQIVIVMDELNNITLKAIKYCFKNMEALGYIEKEDLLKTVALTAITDIFSLFPEYITDEDYTDIMKALLCLSNSCFIDTPHF